MSRLLIVDDEPHILDVLAEVFAGQGYDVDTASGGEEALEKMKTRCPDLMLLDVRMPGKKGGPETLKQAKQIHPRMEVIMVTAVRDQDMVRAAMELGASDYITKPFDLVHLKAAVRSRLDAAANKAVSQARSA